MKFEWGLEDFRVGRRVWISSGASNGECMIGYNYNSAVEPVDWAKMTNSERDIWRELNDKRFCLISLTDGCLYNENLTAQEMVDQLNKYGYQPTTLEGDYMKYRQQVVK